DTLLKRSDQKKNPEIQVFRATAFYELRNFDAAQDNAEAAIRLDPKHQFSRSEFVLAAALEGKKDLDGAREHFNNYLALEPKASNAATIRDHLSQLGTAAALELPRSAGPVASAAALEPLGEVWVPGGINALAKAALLNETPSYPRFFASYCNAIA